MHKADDQHLLFWMCLSRQGFGTYTGVRDPGGDQYGDVYV